MKTKFLMAENVDFLLEHKDEMAFYVLHYDIKTNKYLNEIVFKTLYEAVKEFTKAEPKIPQDRIELIYSSLDEKIDNVIVAYKIGTKTRRFYVEIYYRNSNDIPYIMQSKWFDTLEDAEIWKSNIDYLNEDLNMDIMVADFWLDENGDVDGLKIIGAVDDDFKREWLGRERI